MLDAKMSSLISRLSLNEGSTVVLIEEVSSKLGIKFPNEYVDFLKLSNGGEGTIGDNSYLVLWVIEDLESLNEAYAVNEFAPGLILIGSDGGDTAYGFDTRAEKIAFVEVPFIGMDLNEIKTYGNSFIEFLDYLYHL